MPATLPLNDGATIPTLGLGVWRLSDDQVSSLIPAAVAAGYRHIDTAQGYHNEVGVGEGIRNAGIARDELFITSKQRTTYQGRDTTAESFDATMERLGLTTLDLFLIHWPMPERDLYVQTWEVLAEIQASGRVRSIGVSNFLPEHIDRLIAATGVVPSVNQLELHPYFQQRDVREFHAAHGIVIQSYSPLGGDGAATLTDPVIEQIAAKRGKTPGQVVIRWHLEQDLVVLPKSSSPARLTENFQVWDFALDEDDMARIDALDRPDGKQLPHPADMNDLF